MQYSQKKRSLMIASLLTLTAGCAIPPSIGGNARGKEGSIPESVKAIAAPNQDINTAHLRPEDRCYWYKHSGPVETTLLPLRTVNGNPICAPRET